jgi:dihydrofolate reductase
MSARKVFANITISLDGRTTGRGGPADMSWIGPHAVTDQARDGMIRMTDADTVLLGRANYEGFGGFWPMVADMAEADPRDRQFARWLNDAEKIVFSRTLTAATWTKSRITDREPAEVVRDLRAGEGGDIWVMSSQSIIRQLLEAGEIDRLHLHLAPELVGGGDRLFTDDLPQSSWTLTDLSTTDSGAVWLIYDLKTRI